MGLLKRLINSFVCVSLRKLDCVSFMWTLWAKDWGEKKKKKKWIRNSVSAAVKVPVNGLRQALKSAMSHDLAKIPKHANVCYPKRSIRLNRLK